MRDWRQGDAALLSDGPKSGGADAPLEGYLFDGLTGLPNPHLFLGLLDHALDPDSLDTINAHFGRQRGDEVLVEVGQRLRTLSQAGDVVVRLAGPSS